MTTGPKHVQKKIRLSRRAKAGHLQLWVENSTAELK